MAAKLGLGRLANMSLFLLLSLACYVTPGEAIRMTGATAGDKLRLLDALECQYRLSTRQVLLAALDYWYPPPTSDWQAGHPSLRPWPPLPIPKCGAPCCTTGQVQHSCRLPGGHGGPHVCRARNTDHWELPAERFLEMPASRPVAEARIGDIGLPGLRRAPGLTLNCKGVTTPTFSLALGASGGLSPARASWDGAGNARTVGAAIWGTPRP